MRINHKPQCLFKNKLNQYTYISKQNKAKMKFKVGDIVRLKHVPEEDKVQKYDKYWDGFEKWEGMLATIIREIPQHNAYEIEIHKEIGFKKWLYQEAWLENPYDMNNYRK